MKRLNYILSIGILTVLILSLVYVMPAWAFKPVHQKDIWIEDWEDTETCPGMALQAHMEVENNYFMFFDKAGNWVADAGRGIADKGSFTYGDRTVSFINLENFKASWIDIGDGYLLVTRELSGPNWKASVPGFGVAVGRAGHWVWTEVCHFEGEELVCEFSELLHSGGMVFDHQEAVCNYLAGGQ